PPPLEPEAVVPSPTEALDAGEALQDTRTDAGELAAQVDASVPEPTAAPIALAAGAEAESEEALLREAVPNPESVVIGEPERSTSTPASAAPATTAPLPTASEPDTVSVLVTSVPPGAVVKLDQRVFGRTPIPLRFRTGITFELTFVKSGYLTAQKRLAVTQRKSQKLVAQLKKAPARKR
ncbi:MAG TPA: PEGA domain-containing protein, partial [Myxococcaceae bacterium]|nr:PEGA domain-containing protein [Myxococcaceae bacterium]